MLSSTQSSCSLPKPNVRRRFVLLALDELFQPKDVLHEHVHLWLETNLSPSFWQQTSFGAVSGFIHNDEDQERVGNGVLSLLPPSLIPKKLTRWSVCAAVSEVCFLNVFSVQCSQETNEDPGSQVQGCNLANFSVCCPRSSWLLPWCKKSAIRRRFLQNHTISSLVPQSAMTQPLWRCIDNTSRHCRLPI